MIIMVSGKPRGGKSLRGVQLLSEELEHGTRPIATSLALKLDELQDYLHKRGVRVNVFDRVTLLDAEQVQRFWRFRGYGVELRGTDSASCPIDLEPVYSDPRLQAGTFYVLDELHLTFNSRWWQKVTGEAVWYFSQHGKLGDDIIGIAQRLGSVEVQFRELAQEYRFVRNYRMEKWGKFRAGDGFEETIYFREPGKNAQPAQVNKFTLDVKGIAACYSTQAGIGIGERAAGDGGKKVKGLPFWSLYAMLGVGFCAAWWLAGYVPRLLRLGLGNLVSMPTPAPKTAPARVSAKVSKLDAGAGRPAAGAPPTALAGGFPSLGGGGRGEGGTMETAPAARLYVRGYVVCGHRVNVLLSDGRTLSELDGQLRALHRNFVELEDGTKLYLLEPTCERAQSAQKETNRKESF